MIILTIKQLNKMTEFKRRLRFCIMITITLFATWTAKRNDLDLLHYIFTIILGLIILEFLLNAEDTIIK